MAHPDHLTPKTPKQINSPRADGYIITMPSPTVQPSRHQQHVRTTPRTNHTAPSGNTRPTRQRQDHAPRARARLSFALRVGLILTTTWYLEDNITAARSKHATAIRVGEARKPGPNLESPHYRAPTLEEHSAQQCLHIVQSKAAIERGAFETTVDEAEKFFADQSPASFNVRKFVQIRCMIWLKGASLFH